MLIDFCPSQTRRALSFSWLLGVGVHWVPDLLCTGGGSRTMCIETGTHAAETTSLNMSPVACGEKWGNFYLLFVFLWMPSWAISSVQDGISDVFEKAYIYIYVAGLWCIYMYICPWQVRGNTWGEARGTVAVLFPGCITSTVVALVERCVTVAFQPFVALSKKKKKYKNLLTGMISAL